MGKDHIDIYFKEVGKYPSLSAEQEVKLGMSIQNNYMRYKNEGFGVIVPVEHLPRIFEYVKEAIKKGEDARKTLIQSNLRLVVSIAKDYRKKGLSLDDLIEEGNIGLIKAVEKYNPYYGARFSTYATWWIKQSIRAALNEKAYTIRIPINIYNDLPMFEEKTRDLEKELGGRPTDKEIAEKMEISEHTVETLKAARLAYQRNMRMVRIDQIKDGYKRSLAEQLTYKTDKDKEEQYNAKEINSLIDKAIKNPRDKEIIKMRFGLNGYEEMTLENIGNIFNKTKELVRKVEVKCLNKLNEEISRQRNCPLIKLTPKTL